VAGLAASAGIAGWVEFVLLRRALNHRIGRTGFSARYLAWLWGAAALAAAASWGAKLGIPSERPLLAGLSTLAVYGLIYLGLTLAFGIHEARSMADRVHRRLRRG